MFDSEPLPTYLLVGKYGERGQEISGTRTSARSRCRLCSNQRRHTWNRWIRSALNSVKQFEIFN